MKNSFLDQKFKEFLENFKLKTDYQLVNDFNRETSHNGWVSVRGSYLEALKESFLTREIDISEISSKNTFSLKYPVFLVESDNEKKLVPITRAWRN